MHALIIYVDSVARHIAKWYY